MLSWRWPAHQQCPSAMAPDHNLRTLPGAEWLQCCGWQMEMRLRPVDGSAVTNLPPRVGAGAVANITVFLWAPGGPVFDVVFVYVNSIELRTTHWESTRFSEHATLSPNPTCPIVLPDKTEGFASPGLMIYIPWGFHIWCPFRSTLAVSRWRQTGNLLATNLCWGHFVYS